MQIAIRRFTTDKSIALAYSIFYAMMNVSAIFSASAIDFFRRFIVDQTITFGFITFELTAYRALFLSGACTTIFSMFISFFCISDVKPKDKNSSDRVKDQDIFDEEKANLIENNQDLNENNSGNSKSIGCCGKNSLKDCNINDFSMNKNLNANENDSSIALFNSKDNINNISTSMSLKNQINIIQNNPNGCENINNSNHSSKCIHNSKKDKNKNHSFTSSNQFENEIKIAGPCEILGEVTSQKSFWKFVFMIVLLMGVRIVYRHLDATFPKYMMREFGKDVMYGSIIAINPFLIVILIPIFAPLSYQFSAYSQITFGALITSLSPFFLIIDTQMWSAIMFVVILSIGEALWSPRLYEYTIFITEEGREGIYMALASSPMFIATLITGATSGMLLESFCPEKGPKQSWKMWTLIGLITLTSPVLLFFLKKKIEVTDEELINERIEKEKKKKEQEEKMRLLYEKPNFENTQNQKHHLINSNYNSRSSKFNNLIIEEDKSFTIGNSIVRENEFTLNK